MADRICRVLCVSDAAHSPSASPGGVNPFASKHSLATLPDRQASRRSRDLRLNSPGEIQ